MKTIKNRENLDCGKEMSSECDVCDRQKELMAQPSITESHYITKYCEKNNDYLLLLLDERKPADTLDNYGVKRFVSICVADVRNPFQTSKQS